jgi:outer membrane protein assembly factor BamB
MAVREAWLRCAAVALLVSLAACGSKSGAGKPDAASDHLPIAGDGGVAGKGGAPGGAGAGAAGGSGGAPSDGGADAAAGAPTDAAVDSPGDAVPERAPDAPMDMSAGSDRPVEAGAGDTRPDVKADAPVEMAPCVPMCAGKECGGDGCGGSCTPCASGQHCTALFQCVADIVNDCGSGSGLDPQSPWPTGGRCPARRGASSVRSVQKPVVAWTFALGSANDPAVARDGTLYIATATTDSDRHLQALKPDGQMSWSVPGAYTMQTPSIGPDGTIYFGYNKFVWAVSAAGAVSWKAAIAEDWPSVALGADGTVYASGDSTHDLQAFTAAGAPRFTKPGIAGSETPAIAADGTLYFVGPSGVTALAPDGTQRWQAQIAGASFYSSPALASDGTVYVTFSLASSGGGGGLRALDHATGAELWTAGFGDSALLTPSVAGDGSIYVSLESSVAALDSQGRARWEFFVGDEVGGPPTVGGDGTIYFTSKDDNVYALSPDGTLKWNMPTNYPYGSPVIAADGTLYVHGVAGLMALGCANGACDACVPQCDGRHCGPDGCGGSCGACGTGERCDRLARVCQTAAPPADAGVCGDMRGLQAGSPWPQLARCPARAARGAVDGPHVKPSVQWTYAATGYIRSPVIAADGTIYVASVDKNLHAVTPAGQLRWKFAAGTPVSAAPAIGADGTIYIGTADPGGKVFAVNPDGTKRWSLRFPFRVSGAAGIGGDGVVYFETAGYIYRDRLAAFDPLTGTMLWAPRAGSFLQDGPAVGPDGTIFIHAGGLSAFRPDGTRRWSTALPSASLPTSPPLVNANGDTYASGDSTLAAVKPDGTVRWMFQAQSGKMEVAPTFAADGSILQAVTSDEQYKMLRAFSPDDGSVRWSVSGNGLNGENIHSPLLVDASGWIYYVAYDKSLYALNATGDVQWSLPLGIDVTEAPALGADGTLYLSGADFKLYAVRP